MPPAARALARRAGLLAERGRAGGARADAERAATLADEAPPGSVDHVETDMADRRQRGREETARVQSWLPDGRFLR